MLGSAAWPPPCQGGFRTSAVAVRCRLAWSAVDRFSSAVGWCRLLSSVVWSLADFSLIKDIVTNASDPLGSIMR